MRAYRSEASACPLSTQNVAVTGGSALLADNGCTMPGGREVSDRVAGFGTMSGLAVGRSVLRSPVTLCTLLVDARYLNVRAAPWRRVRLGERLVGSRDRCEVMVIEGPRASSCMHPYHGPKSSEGLLAVPQWPQHPQRLLRCAGAIKNTNGHGPRWGQQAKKDSTWPRDSSKNLANQYKTIALKMYTGFFDPLNLQCLGAQKKRAAVCRRRRLRYFHICTGCVYIMYGG